MIEQPSVLLNLTNAYSFKCNDNDERPEPGGGAASRSGETRRLLNISGELLQLLEDDQQKEFQKEFADAGQSVITELGRCELERSVWVPEIKVHFPAGPTVNAEAKLLIGLNDKAKRSARVVFLSLAIAFEEMAGTDQLIALLQSHLRDDDSLDGLTVESSGTEHTSCKRFMESCARQLGLDATSPTPFWITEVRTQDAEALLSSSNDYLIRRTYGLLTLDEGWRYVPQSRAREVVCNQHWSSRDFLWVGAFGTGVVVYNGKDRRYGRDASAFFCRWFAAEREYYSDIFHVAGLDHGVLFAVEAATELKLTAQSIIDEMESLMKRQKGGRFTTIQASWSEPLRGQLPSMQLRAFSYLERVRGVGIGELGSLDKLIANENRLPAMINEVARFGEMVDGQSMNLATIRLTTMVVVLTLVTVLIAFIK
jgi:hypothetical protein